MPSFISRFFPLNFFSFSTVIFVIISKTEPCCIAVWIEKRQKLWTLLLFYFEGGSVEGVQWNSKERDRECEDYENWLFFHSNIMGFGDFNFIKGSETYWGVGFGGFRGFYGVFGGMGEGWGDGDGDGEIELFLRRNVRKYGVELFSISLEENDYWAWRIYYLKYFDVSEKIKEQSIQVELFYLKRFVKKINQNDRNFL